MSYPFRAEEMVNKPNISEQVKKRRRSYDLLNAKIKPMKISNIIGVSLRPPSSPDLKLLAYAIWGVLEKKNANFHPDIGSLKTDIEKEWNKIYLKACKSFWRRVNIIIE